MCCGCIRITIRPVWPVVIECIKEYTVGSVAMVTVRQ
jgi:hypothetical protein